MRSKDHVTVKFLQSHKHRQRGFSLMELMTVVVIVGVLSAMAIPTFSDYIYKSRATEATEFLGVMRLREEAYRAEFGAYCPTLPPEKFPTAVGSLDTKGNLVPDPSTTGRNTTDRDRRPAATRRSGRRPHSGANSALLRVVRSASVTVQSRVIRRTFQPASAFKPDRISGGSRGQ